jgi:hypothetical protein
VAVLEGGLPAWKAAGLQLEQAPASSDALEEATAAARAASSGSSKYKATLMKDKVRVLLLSLAVSTSLVRLRAFKQACLHCIFIAAGAYGAYWQDDRQHRFLLRLLAGARCPATAAQMQCAA